MAKDSGDLQRRRPASSRAKPSRDRTTTVRRRKRKSDPNRSACVATVAFIAIFVPLGFLANRRLGHTPQGGRILQGWKPKHKHPISHFDISTDARSAERESRYNSLYRKKFDASQLGYDVFNCPPTPPIGYPRTWLVPEVLTSWNPNDVTTIAPSHRDVYHSLCIFDHETQYDIALTYRNAEKPFIMRNDPSVMKVVDKWDDGYGDYLHTALGDVEEHRVERSPVNNFMWYRLRGRKGQPEGYIKPPNDETEMTYGEWLEHALEKEGVALNDEKMLEKAQALKERRLSLLKTVPEEDDHSVENGQEESDDEKDKKYYYFRLNASLKKIKESGPDAFVYDSMSIFDPRKRKHSQFYIVNPEEERGLNCRFGARGIIAANHFDASRNMIAILGGERRYIIAPPAQCKNMALYPRSHPSTRHSSIDWSNPTEWDKEPNFRQAQVTEVIMHAGDVL